LHENRGEGTDQVKIHDRPYNPADLDRITDLDRLCFEAPFRFSRASMRRFAEASNAETVIAETATGGLAGFIITHREPIETPEPAEAGYLLTIDVAPAFRRHGVAGRLLTRAENWVRSFHGAALLLHVYL
jgi:ribosomal-protein-alanine N-acetyltransferase